MLKQRKQRLHRWLSKFRPVATVKVCRKQIQFRIGPSQIHSVYAFKSGILTITLPSYLAWLLNNRRAYLFVHSAGTSTYSSGHSSRTPDVLRFGHHIKYTTSTPLKVPSSSFSFTDIPHPPRSLNSTPITQPPWYLPRHDIGVESRWSWGNILRKEVIHRRRDMSHSLGRIQERLKQMTDIFLTICFPIVGPSNIHSDNPLSSIQ
jgi:hypothetical protein